jgi:hypothetical protein
VAAVVVGFACLEAEAGGELVLGEAAEFAEGDHRDLLLHGLFLGEGDGLSGTIREHERAVLGLNGEVKSDMHGCPFLHDDLDDSRALQNMYTPFMPKSRTSTVEYGQTSARGFNGYKCRYNRSLSQMERSWRVLARIPYTPARI